MRRVLILVGAGLLLSVSAAAQAPAGVGGNARTGRRSPSIAELTSWQVSVGYQYNLANLKGTPFNTNGVTASAAHFWGSWFGVEGQLGAGFGNTGSTTTPPNLDIKSLFAGAGPHLAYRGYAPIEPWVHGLLGMEHLRFTQIAGVPGSNTALAWQAGGGIDFHLTPHVAVRGEVDWIGTQFFSTNQRHFQAVTGLVFNF